MVELAKRAEELDYASLWTFQRLLFPADEAEQANPRWQPVYRSVHDPLVTLSFLAAHTSRVRLGIAVLNMPWYSPDPAREAWPPRSTTCRDGRLDLGLGLGWSQVEYDAAGAPFERRGERADDFLACLTRDLDRRPGRLSRASSTSYGNAHVHPRPVQQPHPPVLLGGSAPPALRRAGRLSQGWISSSGTDLTDHRVVDRHRPRRGDGGRARRGRLAVRLPWGGARPAGRCGTAAPADRLARRDPR